MLIVSRKVGQSVMIGSGELTIGEITPSRVLLIFTASAGAAVRVCDLYYGEERELGGAVIYVRRRRADQVRVQINAPRCVRVLRGELCSVAE